MTNNSDRAPDRPVSANTIALTLLLGVVLLLGFIAIMGATKPGPELWSWRRLGAAAAGLLVSAGAVWGLSRLPLSRTKAITLVVVLGSIAMMGFAGTRGVVGGLIATDTLSGPWAWQTKVILAKNLLLLFIPVVVFVWLKPWVGPASDEPVSPRTHRTNKLFAWSGLVALPGMLALVHATRSPDDPFGVVSNSAIPPGIALFVIASWVLAMALSWWWYFSADEHERHAYDFGTLVGGGVFLTVTPAWWIAARAGLLPQPDAMLLWGITMAIATIGWAWRR